jgi:cytochrome d ubiquinol oxidase subunit I
MKTSEAVSPGLTGTEATISLVGFAVVYLALLGLYTYVITRVIRNGPPGREQLRERPDRTPMLDTSAAGGTDDD